MNNRACGAWWMVMALIALAAPALAGPILADTFVIKNDRYTVADVLPAELHGKLNPGQLSQPLGLSPALGKPQVMSGTLLLARLKAKTGAGFLKTTGLRAPERILLKRQDQQVDASALLESLSAPDSPFAKAHPGFRAMAKEPFNPMILPTGRLTLKVPSAQQPMVAVSFGGKELHRVNLDPYFEFQLPSLVAVRSIARGETLHAEDVRSLWVPWRQKTSSLSVEQVGGKVARRAIPPGAAVSADLLGQPLLVRRGETVKVLARRGRLVVSLSGQALSSGGEGEIVRVRHAGLKRVFTALVLEEGLVSVAGNNPMGEVN